MAGVADSCDIAVLGSPARARDTAVAALAARGFTLTWLDQWVGTATKGSKRKQLFLGAFAQHFEVGVAVLAVDERSVVRLTRPSPGVSAGLAGARRARKAFDSLTAELVGVFRTHGVLAPPPQ